LIPPGLADGVIARTNGLTWECEDFGVDDRRHPSDCGKDKVSDVLIDFFTSDESTIPWFLEDESISGRTAEVIQLYSI
jgi:hypothetical protein